MVKQNQTVGSWGRMTIFFRFSRLAAAVVLAAFMAVWTLHPWTTGDTSPFATVNDAEGLAITVADGSATPTGAIFRFENSTDGEWQFGQEFWIEKKENGEWREIRSLRSRAFDALSYLLAPHSVREEVYSFSDSYGRLTSGEYRLGKELLRERSGGWESQYVAAEFAVK